MGFTFTPLLIIHNSTTGGIVRYEVPNEIARDIDHHLSLTYTRQVVGGNANGEHANMEHSSKVN